MTVISEAISDLNTPFLRATILRIMARVPVQRGALSPVTTDAISQEYAQRSHRIGHTTDTRCAVAFTAQPPPDRTSGQALAQRPTITIAVLAAVNGEGRGTQLCLSAERLAHLAEEIRV